MTLQLGSHGPLVSRWTDVMLKRFRSYALGVDGLPLRNDGYYGLDEAKVQREYERRTGQPQDGVVSEDDLAKLRLALPVIFTTEGHLSDMWAGPCADTARELQRQGVCYWQPVWYDCQSIPFNNRNGVDSLTELVGTTVLPSGQPFPPGTPWGIIGFSQGGMVVSDFMRERVLNNGELAWRLKDFKRGLAFGNPDRAADAICSWAINPPAKGTGGIMIDDRFVTKGTPVEGLWAENARRGDMFAEGGTDPEGLDKSAIARIVTQNSWAGGDSAILSRVLKLITNPGGQSIPAILALISAIKFAVANPNPHYTTAFSPGDVEWMRGVAA
jgi:hypothetical protein